MGDSNPEICVANSRILTHIFEKFATYFLKTRVGRGVGVKGLQSFPLETNSLWGGNQNLPKSMAADLHIVQRKEVEIKALMIF